MRMIGGIGMHGGCLFLISVYIYSISCEAVPAKASFVQLITEHGQPSDDDARLTEH